MWPGMASSSNSSSGYVGQSRTTANHVSKSSNTNFIPCIGFSSGSSSSGAGDILHGTTPTTYRRQQRLNSLDSFSDKNIHKSSGQYSISASKSPQYEQSHLPMSLLSSPPAMPSLLGPSFASSTYTKFESSINQPSSMTTNSIDSESGEIPLLSNFGTEEEFQFLGTAMPYSPTTCSFPGRESTKSIRDDDYYADDDDDDDDDEYEDDSCTMFRPRGRRTRRGKAGGSTRVSNDRSNGGVFKSSRDRSEKFGRSGGGGNKSLGLEGGGGGGKGNKNAIAAGAAAAVTHDNESIDIHDALNKYAFKFGSDDSGRGGSSGRTTSKSASSLTADLLKSSAFSVMSNSFLNPFPTHHRLNPDHGQIILYRPLTIIPDTNSSFPTKHQFTFTLPFNSTPTDDFMTLSPTTVSSGSFPVMNEAIPIASSVGNPTLSGVATATTSTTNSPITRRHHNTSPNRQQEQAKLMMMLESNGNDACDEGVANVMSSSSSSSNTNNQGLSPLVGLDRNSPRPVHRFHHVGNQGAAASPVSARNLFPNGSSGKGNGGLSSNTANMELD
ncbi:hypothetical protein BDR26DRAFT_872621 [Obelidium mucronatum]|nr:hypothetical protein BDR26DRAFT_872621 [Obelidium mucronatum]